MFNVNRRQFLLAVAATAGRAQGKSLIDHPKNLKDWQQRRQEILANLQLVTGPFPNKKRLPLDIQEEGSEQLPAFVRTKLTYVSEVGDRVPAYLLVPKGLKGRTPGILCLHQTTRIGKGEPAGVGGKPNLHYAQELAERGYVTLAPDYPNFGDYQYDPYTHGYASATMKAIWNHTRAVDLLSQRPDVLPNRIACVGHSLGGHNTIFVSLFDDRIRVLVTSGGFSTFANHHHNDLADWSTPAYMPRIATIYHNNPAEMPVDFPEIMAVLAPRPVFINAPIRDADMEVAGAHVAVEQAAKIYQNIYGLSDRLVIESPDTVHDFPPEVRQHAYAFLAKWLAN